MPKKKEILQQKSVAREGVKRAKTRSQKVVLRPKKATRSNDRVICKATLPKQLAYLKAPPKSSVSCPATHLVVRRSGQVLKPKKFD
jgi:hypothetical protein